MNGDDEGKLGQARDSKEFLVNKCVLQESYQLPTVFLASRRLGGRDLTGPGTVSC